MSAGAPVASGRGEILEALLWFLPDRVQTTVLGLIVLAVVASWAVGLRRRIAHRRAVRDGRPVHAAARYGRGRGAGHLGAHAPGARQGSGAGHLGAYAPQAQQPSGADFLGAHAPQQRQGQGQSPV